MSRVNVHGVNPVVQPARRSGVDESKGHVPGRHFLRCSRLHSPQSARKPEDIADAVAIVVTTQRSRIALIAG